MAHKDVRRDLIKRVRRVVLKLGSYVLTTPAWKLDRRVFAHLVQSIVTLRERGLEFVVVSSGAVASGMGKLGFKERPRVIAQEQAAAAIGQISLMGLYERLFKKAGINVAQILLTHGDLKDRRRFLNARQTISTLLAFGAVPIINENDTTVVDEIKFGDNDYLSSLVTNLVQADLLIILTDIDGCYDKDPHQFSDARLIPVIEEIDDDVEKLALGTQSTISRGGMITKIKAAKTAAHFGIPTIIANGKAPQTIPQILAGAEVGTLILPQQNKLTSRKHWIAFTLKPQGSIYVDDGARAAMVDKGKSLLPSGIIDVKGDFDSGEAVSCCDRSGHEFARGLTAYSAADISRIKGLKTTHIEETLGYCHDSEVINRDNMVLLR